MVARNKLTQCDTASSVGRSAHKASDETVSPLLAIIPLDVGLQL